MLVYLVVRMSIEIVTYCPNKLTKISQALPPARLEIPVV
jgi:hypothetical protein